MTTDVTTTEGIAQSLVPFYTDGGKKAKYLSYTVAGFSVMESIKLVPKLHLKTVQRWRDNDPNFASIEQRASTELRKQLSNELIDIEFTRNFRLFLAKDFEILFKDATGITLTDKEQSYLLVIRKFYTPQQLAVVKQLVGGVESSPEMFDFTKLVIDVHLEKETISHGVP